MKVPLTKLELIASIQSNHSCQRAKKFSSTMKIILLPSLCILSLVSHGLCLPSLIPGLPGLPDFPDPLGFSGFGLGQFKNLLGQAEKLSLVLKGASLAKCPEVEEPPSDFEMEDFLGTWYEIERTALYDVLETGQKCTQLTFAAESKDTLTLNTTFVNSLLNTPLTHLGSISLTNKPNVLELKLGLLRVANQLWIVDTDLDNYALIFTCKQHYGLNYRNAWILSRKPILDDETRAKLVKKLDGLGVDGSTLFKADQSCSTFIPI